MDSEIFYLFGTECVETYEQEGFEKLLNQIEEGKNNWRVFIFDEDTDPSELLEAYTGFDRFTEIEKEEFDTIINLRCPVYETSGWEPTKDESESLWNTINSIMSEIKENI
jgi:hypothetical protein